MQGDYKNLLIQQDEGVVRITLNRPESANALNTALALDIFEVFKSLPPARAIILTGSGTKAFCAGADLKERKGMDEAGWHSQHQALEDARDALLECKAPVIAAVNGAAMGGGLELALCCDFIYAAAHARFALTETTLGIMPGMGGTQTLPRAIGMHRAKELIYTGRIFSAEEAYAWGMINRICPPETLMDEVAACARTIAANAPLAVTAAKQAIGEGASLPLPRALACELGYYNTLLVTNDRKEGIDSFNEKRKPRFTGE